MAERDLDVGGRAIGAVGDEPQRLASLRTQGAARGEAAGELEHGAWATGERRLRGRGRGRVGAQRAQGRSVRVDIASISAEARSREREGESDLGGAS